jgi:hypothetical protein
MVKIGKPNNLSIFGSKKLKTKGPKQHGQFLAWSFMTVGRFFLIFCHKYKMYLHDIQTQSM